MNFSFLGKAGKVLVPKEFQWAKPDSKLDRICYLSCFPCCNSHW